MPKEISHWILADILKTKIKGGSMLHKIIHEKYPLYLLGAILHDSPLYTFKNPRVRYLSDFLHARAEQDERSGLVALAQQYEITHDPAYMALIVGGITHRIADMVFHPAVFAFSADNIARHFQFESFLDCSMLQMYKKEYGINYLHHNFTKGKVMRLFRVARKELLARMHVLSRFYGWQHRLSEEDLMTTVKKHARLQGLLSNKMILIGIKLLRIFPNIRRYSYLCYPLNRFSKKHALIPTIMYRHPYSGTFLVAEIDHMIREFCIHALEICTNLERILVGESGISLSKFCATLSSTSLLHGLPRDIPLIPHFQSDTPIKYLTAS